MYSADVEIYAALARAVESLGMRWYLFGAQAAILHGAVRFSEDIDITVDIANQTYRVLIDALRGEGFEPRFDDEGFIERTRVIPMVYKPTGTPVDVVLSGPGIEEVFFEGRIRVEIEKGLEVPVARAEDIVVMKILSARPKDLQDVSSILSANISQFDDDRVRWLLGQLERALDRNDLLSLFESHRAKR
ncbi:MAG: nucleotidyl transferase AbiEii/AbiGii toxin family protein [Deltaproteobacteria bacterium]|nr:nucleotidyl transferase AbiEii/AbiGii toxin family protein [Deltaproteobacteria bacterium]